MDTKSKIDTFLEELRGALNIQDNVSGVNIATPNDFFGIVAIVQFNNQITITRELTFHDMMQSIDYKEPHKLISHIVQEVISKYNQSQHGH